MKIDLVELKKREDLISCQEHIDLPLLLWNYRPECQYGGKWDEYSLMSRGLITDIEGHIIARPFKKFFNLNEVEETKIENLPVELPIITEKIDGSLGIQYYDGEEVKIATRGSFKSEQSKFATEWMTKYTKADFLEGKTYLYEIIYPENRIVVNYGDREDMVLLAVIDIETGKEEDYIFEAKRLKMSYAKIVNSSLNELINSLSELNYNQEGFVVKYSNGLRLKMKGEEYKRLHRILTGLSVRSIWENLKLGQKLDLTNIPDEFYVWMRSVEENLTSEFLEWEKESVKIFKEVKDLKTRKEQALKIKELRVAGIVFAMLSGKNYKDIIWKMLKPERGGELTFRKNDF